MTATANLFDALNILGERKSRTALFRRRRRELVNTVGVDSFRTKWIRQKLFSL